MRRSYTSKLVPRARQLREAQTPAERKLWHEFLQTLPVRVRRQCPLHSYILDFYIHAHGLIIELDGASHDTPEAQAYDAERTWVLEAAGLRVLRFRNRDVLWNFEGVCRAIEEALGVEGDPPPASPEPPLKGSL